MSRLFLSFLGLFLVLSLQGCSFAKIQPVQTYNQEGSAQLVVFRPEAWMAKFNEMIVTIDGNDVAVLHGDQYVSVDVSPGQHLVSVRGNVGLSSELTVAPGSDETFYFEAAGSASNAFNFIPITVFFKPTFYIEQSDVFDSAGLTEISVEYN